MKINIITLVLLVAFISCNNDNKAKLEKLKVQREELNTQISQLEAVVNPSGQDSLAKAVNVKTEEVAPTEFNHFVEVQGVVDADKNVSVGPQSPGIVSGVYVKEGSKVGRGTLLAELDSKVLEQSEAEIQTQLDLATTIFTKQKALWDKNIGSEVQFLQAKNNKEALERRVKTLQEQVDMAKIYSPISGTVESVPLKVGQLASPGMPNSAIRVINMSTVKITANVSENYATRIKNGDKAYISFPDLGKVIETTLSFTSRFIDPTNRTFQVECRFPANDIELRANMIAYVKIKDYSNDSVITLPVNYVQSNQEGKFLYLAQQADGKWIAKRTKIETGMDYNGNIEILSGITTGDKVITSGFQSLKDGELIIF